MKFLLNKILHLIPWNKVLILFTATNIWKDLPTYLKNLSVFTFPKKIKHFLLSEQQTK